ncbi:MAG: hypothetical protein ACREDR_46965 [Blastocatellia bacterium]
MTVEQADVGEQFSHWTATEQAPARPEERRSHKEQALYQAYCEYLRREIQDRYQKIGSVPGAENFNLHLLQEELREAQSKGIDISDLGVRPDEIDGLQEKAKEARLSDIRFYLSLVEAGVPMYSNDRVRDEVGEVPLNYCAARTLRIMVASARKEGVDLSSIEAKVNNAALAELMQNAIRADAAVHLVGMNSMLRQKAKPNEVARYQKLFKLLGKLATEEGLALPKLSRETS